ncbi:VWA domain-containing protein [Colwellia asteriadis]|uniref:VWA domain-containing protein n=1 Tax=Colwellia asteriadis TaxID=517723 RepID=A0ABP3WC46_9GAMM
MILFKHLWVFSLLLLPIILVWLLPTFKQKSLAIRIPFFALAADAIGAKASQGAKVNQKSLLTWLFAGIIWISLVTALAQPMQLGATIKSSTISRDIMLAIDLSGSMDEPDFPTDNGETIQRLQGVKQVVSQYISDRKDDRIGLIVFGTQAYLQVPFTQDLTSAEQLLNETQVAMAGPHTAIGDAIGLALKTFEASKVDDKILILLTDGADTGSRMSPLNAAQIAKQSNLRIFTIGIGDEHGEGQYRVDFSTLKKIASTADGEFYQAQNSQALTNIYQQIDQIAAVETPHTKTRKETSLVHFPLLIALSCLVLILLVQVLTHREQSNA